MNIFLEPNVAYLILVAGFFLAILALFSPGSGILEVSALFAILLAGYAVLNLPFNGWALGILILGVFPFIIAVRRSGRAIYLLPSLIALVVGSVFLFRTPTGGSIVNPFLALIASVLVSGFLWLATRKVLEALALRPVQDPHRLVGAVGETRTAIGQEGTVYVGGENWSARSRTPIPPNTRVRVLSRNGLVLEVEPLELPAQ